MADPGVTDPQTIDQMRQMIGAAPPNVIANTQLSPGGKVQFATPEAQAWFTDNAQQYGHSIADGTLAPMGAGQDYRSMAAAAAQKHGVPVDMFVNQIAGESGFNPNAHNSAGPGHIGIAQFDPQTAAHYGIDPRDPAQSLDAAARYMADLYKRTGSWPGALQSYVGATTPEGLQRVMANKGYARAFAAAGGGAPAPTQVAQAASPIASQATTPAASSGLSPELRAALTAAVPAATAAPDTTQQAPAQPKTPDVPTLSSPSPGHPATAFQDALKAIASRRSANPFA